MGSPVNSGDIVILADIAPICDRLQALINLTSQVKAFLGWILGGDDEISDDAVDGMADRLTPVAAMIGYAGLTMPSSKWMVCDGSLLSRVTYAKLFARIGVQYGAGDGSTTFAIPDLRDRTLVSDGPINTFAAQIGAVSATVTLADHYHYTGNLNGTNSDVNLYTDADNSAGPATNAILVTSDDSSVNPPSFFMSTITTMALKTGSPVLPPDPTAVTVSTVSPATVAYWIIKVL